MVGAQIPNIISRKGRDKEAALQSCSQEKVFIKYTTNLQENVHAEV